jgi:hypothetical protein
MAQTPAVHKGAPPSAGVLHVFPHAPQLFGSLPIKFTQAIIGPLPLGQSVAPSGHAQALPRQTVAPGAWGGGHVVPQAPQLFGSVIVDVQAVPQKLGMAVGQQVVPLQV